jgi:hypothetical protein
MFLPRATARIALPVVLATFCMAALWSTWGSTMSFLAHRATSVALSLEGGTLSQSVLTKALRATITTNTPRDLSPMLAIVAPCSAGFLFAAALSLVFGKSRHPGRDYTWWSVMRRPGDDLSPASTAPTSPATPAPVPVSAPEAAPSRSS